MLFGSNHTENRRFIYGLNLYIFTSASVLSLTAIFKLFTLLTRADSLNGYDPVFGLKFKFLLLLVVNIELLVVVGCVFIRKTRNKLIAITWLSGCFLLYKVGIYAVDWKPSCNCLGFLSDLLSLSDHHAGIISTIISIIMFSSGIIAIYIHKTKIINK
jgi:hypothetical protein